MIKTLDRGDYVLIFSDEGYPIRKKGEDRSYSNATELQGENLPEYEEVK